MVHSASSDPGRLAHSYDLLRQDWGWTDALDLALIEISGDDRKAWLQGQLTNDLRPCGEGSSLDACLCSATGQVQAIVRLWFLADRTFLVTDRACADAVMERVERMVVMEDVRARRIDELRLVSFQGPGASHALSSRADLPTLDIGWVDIEGCRALALRSDHTGAGGWDLWMEPRGFALSAEGRLEPATLDVARLEAGFPRWGADVSDRTLAPELGPAFESRTVSYAKGCYTGQEVLMRVHSRGHTNRTWVGLLCESPVVAGAAVRHASREDAGVVTSVADSPRFGCIAGAMLRNEAANEGETVEIETDSGPTTAEVVSLPFLRLD